MPRSGVHVLLAGATLIGSAWAQTPPLHRTQFIATGAEPIAIVAADLDADARPDFVVLDGTDLAAAVFRGLGAARFERVATLPLAATPRRAALADVTGDQDADLVWIGVGFGGSTPVLAVEYGALGAAFAGGAVVALSFSPESFSLADLDADGDLDVVTSGEKSGTGKLVIHPNHGGVFGAEIVIDNARSRDLACGDLDGDGLPEIVAASSNTTRLYANAGAFSFAPPYSYTDAAESVRVVIADVSGDGKQDVATAVVSGGFPGWSRVVVRHGRGDGSLDDSAQFYLTTLTIEELIAADVDADGDIDLEGFHNAGVVQDWVAEGVGQRRVALHNTFLSARGQIALDADGDGDLDVLSIDFVRPGVFLHRRAAGDGLGVSASFDSPGFWLDAVFCDTDQDGRLDVVARNADGLVVHRGLPGAGLAEVSGSVNFDTLPSETQAFPLAALDMNQDGDLDIAAVNGDLVQVALGAAGAAFGPLGPAQFIGSGHSGAIALGDLDHDGAADLVVAKTFGGGGNLYVNRNQNGGFTFTFNYASVKPARDVALADFNGDTHLDAVIATDDGFAGEMVVRFGDGTLALGPGLSLPVARATFVDTVDWNGDGKLDIVGGSPATVWISSGVGGFTALPSLPAPSDPSARLRAVRDVDGDGSLDLVYDAMYDPTHQRFGALLMQRRLGSGMVEEIVPNSARAAVYFADMDGDGRSEILQSSTSPLMGYPGAVVLQRPFPGPTSCGGTVERYGTACAAIAGGELPSLVASGCATAGGSLALELDFVQGGGTAFIFFGSGIAATPLGHGCALAISGVNASPTVYAFAGPGDYGIAVFETVVSPALSGLDVRAQAFVVPPNGVSFAASNGVRIAVQ